ncbi:Na+/H+ antiporter [Sphingomonas morindae]|uniref:Na+/H+ antiporter n=1 Tax=Sphingomonas morindae TaxID=1541170 RepID=A0ABY4XAT3_9SPHN|nr:Na+/H+ antiporter [Sphingomonas morindae]USI74065.1 Na+/H+ antiporter [Sphingomonas morindae]
MEAFTVALILLVAVAASAAIGRMVPAAIPTPLVQIAVGGAIGLLANIRVELDPELFFLVLLPPLLFLDGWRLPKDSLREDGPIIIELALGLVVFTVIGAGFFIHWMVPALPMAICFALAAVLSPTDPIAVSSIAQRVPVPPRLMHILEGESLFNDASGLVCLRFAIAAAVTGHFSLREAGLDFLWSALAGLALGAGLTIVVIRAKGWLTRHFGEEPGAQILVSLLLPFGAYLLAERAGASGILAAVAAGVAMSFAERNGRAGAETRLRRTSVWDAIQFSANGIVFVLLGEQMPGIAAGAIRAVQSYGGRTGWWLACYVVAITLVLAALRFCWVWASLRLTLLRRRDQRPFRSSDLRLVAATSCAGVRGAITLAGILTLPLTLADGSPLPGRDFVIFLAAGVILLSLLIATVALPLLLKGLVLPPDRDAELAEQHVRAQVYQAALRAIQKAERAHADARDAPLYQEAGARLAEFYARRVAVRGEDRDPAETRQLDRIESELRLAGLRAARREALRLARGREAGSLLVRRIVRELDLLELRYGGGA